MAKQKQDYDNGIWEDALDSFNKSLEYDKMARKQNRSQISNSFTQGVKRGVNPMSTRQLPDTPTSRNDGYDEMEY